MGAGVSKGVGGIKKVYETQSQTASSHPNKRNSVFETKGDFCRGRKKEDVCRSNSCKWQ